MIARHASARTRWRGASRACDRAPRVPSSSARQSPPAQVAADLVFVPVFGEGDKLEDLPAWTRRPAANSAAPARAASFARRLYDVFMTPVTTGGWRAGRIALVGAGRLEDLDAERMRRVAATCGYFARRRRILSIGWVVREAPDAARSALSVADGLSQADFDTSTYKKDEGAGSPPAKVVITAPDADAGAIAEAVRRGRIIGARRELRTRACRMNRATCSRRVSSPRASKRRHVAAGLSVDVLDEERIRAAGHGTAPRRRAGQRRAAAPDRAAARAADRARRRRCWASSAKASRSTPAASRSSRPTAWSA